MNKKYFFVFRLIVSCALLFALFRLVPYTKILDTYQNSKKLYLVLSFFVFLFAHLVSVYRWKVILSRFGKKVSFFDLGGSFLSGTFFNLFFPSCIAGDVFRGISISVRDGETSKVISSVLMDRFCGATGMALFAVLSFMAAGTLLMREEVIIPLAIFCAAVVLGALIVFSKTFVSWALALAGKNNFIRKKLVSFHDNLYLFRSRPASFIKGVFLSFFIQFCTVASFYLAALAFGYSVDIFYFLILVPIIIAISAIPITIAGAGTREASSVYFFSFAGIPAKVGLGISLLELIFLVVLGLIGGIFYVAVYHRRLQCDT